ncbi:MAG: riboflavin biosynthesis protein RibD [Gammaproteobacteria bacterium]|nr:MAG: riboflavin biosynthesis protein RibD [Gammaproteobacteria bacterium]
MCRAIELAKLGHYTTSPNPRVGCVIVKEDFIVGEGFHKKAGTGHAEVNALAQAGAQANGATAYVTLEPCSHYGRTPPCAAALIKSGISHVIIAMVDPNPQVSGKGIKLLEQAGINAKVGLLNGEAKKLNIGFIKLMTEHLPYVRLKMATSLDGKTAMASGESKWITSALARKDVQRLRSQSCAIICGADSVMIDQAKMTVRHSDLGELADSYPENELRQPVRVVIDSRYRLTPDLALFQYESPIIIVRGVEKLEKQQHWPHFVEQVSLPLTKKSLNKSYQTNKVDLKSLLTLLGKRGFNDLLVESGANLAGAFIEQNLIDEFILYQAPKLMGADAKSMLTMPSIERLDDAKTLEISETTMVGNDLRIVAKFN